MNNNSRIIRRRKKRKGLKIIRALLFIFITLLLVVGGYAGFLFYKAQQVADQTYEEIDREAIPDHRTEKIKVKEDPFTMLLMGVDDQEGGLGRADVLMLVTVNPKTEDIFLVSIPRDTRTYFPDWDKEDKINHSYGINGVTSTIKTVTNLLDIPIDYYVTTNFQGFEDVVDSLGGITVDVPFTFKAQLTGSLKWKTYYEGEMDLNGNEALAYVRMRKSDPMGDFGRNERQKQVVKEIVKKSASLTSITKIDNVLDDVGENVRTNIPSRDFLSFVQLYSKLKDTEIQSLKLEGYDDTIGSVYYFIPSDDSINEINETLNSVLDGTYVPEPETTEDETNTTTGGY
ncbi:LCP family protein [Fredinandcohnia humi]